MNGNMPWRKVLMFCQSNLQMIASEGKFCLLVSTNKEEHGGIEISKSKCEKLLGIKINNSLIFKTDDDELI